VEYELGVDLGTTQTAAAVYEDGRVDVVPLGSRRKEIPSLVFLHTDGQVLVGEAAERRGAVEPGRLAREFKRRVGDPVPVLLGGSPYSAHALMARLLGEVVAIVTRHQDAPPNTVTVTHPANWGPYKRDLLAQAARLAEVDSVTLCPEPEAAAVQYAAGVRVRPGDVVAVYDLGGGTFDAAVLRKTETGFTVLGEPEGIEQLGGIDFDEAVFGYVVATLGAAAADLDPDDDDVTAALARLRRDCVTAKEALSFDTETMIPVALPGLHTRVRLNRSEFEAMIRPALGETVAATHRALRSAGVTPAELTSVLLAGGSSRIPLVGQLLGADFDARVVLDPRPEHTIALGAARAGALTAASTVVEEVSVGAGTPPPRSPVTSDRTSPAGPVPPPVGGPPGRLLHDPRRDGPERADRPSADLLTGGAERPRRGTPVLAALAVLLVLVGLGGVWWLNRSDPADEPAGDPGGWTTVRLPDSPAAFEAAAVTAFGGKVSTRSPAAGRPVRSCRRRWRSPHWSRRARCCT
jgi:molecular chaperone DnaK (HSP70)